MLRRVSAALLAAITLFVSAPAPADARTELTAATAAVYDDCPETADPREVSLKYSRELPSVPYMAIDEYYSMMLAPLGDKANAIETVSAGEGIYRLRNLSPGGSVLAEAEADINKGTVYFSDIEAFTNLMQLKQEDMENTYYDGAPFVRWQRSETAEGSGSATLYPGKYGIRLIGEGDKLYLPLPTLSDLFSDLYGHRAMFNGDSVVISYSDASAVTVLPEFYGGSYMRGAYRGEDLAEFTYNELCFALDSLYGYPSASRPVAVVKGMDGKSCSLDEALEYCGEAGRSAKELLRSTDIARYALGLLALDTLMYDGGHTLFSQSLSNGVAMLEYNRAAGSRFEQMRYAAYGTPYNGVGEEDLRYAWAVGPLLRETAAEREHGSADWLSTRKKTLDRVSFPQTYELNKTLYYYGEEKLAYCIFERFEGEDSFSAFLDALERARLAGARYFALDLSNNRGGSADIALAIEAVLTGSAELRTFDPLTGRKQIQHYLVDCNLDGRFTDEDAEVYRRYANMRFAVITSQRSFSCANLLSSMLKDRGVAVIGERSGGGACAVQDMCTADGAEYRISSFKARLTDAEWKIIDDGVPTIGDANSAWEHSCADCYTAAKLSALLDAFYGKDTVGSGADGAGIETRTSETGADGERITTVTVTLPAESINAPPMVVSVEKKVELKDGSIGTVLSDGEGNTVSASAQISAEAARKAGADGTVTLPLTVRAAEDIASAAPIVITLPQGCDGVRVRIPLENAAVGVAAAISAKDGRETEAKASYTDETGTVLRLGGSAVVRLYSVDVSFVDVPEGRWYTSPVKWAASRGIMRGTGDAFEPGAPLSRAMMVQLLYNLDGSGETWQTVRGFDDVTDGKWYAASVSWAVSSGVALGEGKSFGAARNITREQIAVMLYNYARGIKNTGRAAGSASALAGFADAGNVSRWAYDAVAWAVGNGILKGTENGALDPKGEATRAQAAAIIERFVRSILA